MVQESHRYKHTTRFVTYFCQKSKFSLAPGTNKKMEFVYEVISSVKNKLYHINKHTYFRTDITSQNAEVSNIREYMAKTRFLVSNIKQAESRWMAY